jgi:hypothetical protein
MSFKSFETPFSDVQGLGCRDLLWGERLVLDLFEYLESGHAEETAVPGEKILDAHTIGLTKSSRIWRLTFERAFAVRVRDESVRLLQPQKTEEPPLPSRYCFTEKSAWLCELFPDAFDPRIGDLTPTHYIFDLLDDFIEIVADDNPTIQEIENDVA